MDKLNIDKLKNVLSGLNSLKSKVSKLYIGKLGTDLSKLSDVVKNDVVKKTEYDELVEKVNNINTIATSDLDIDLDTNDSGYDAKIGGN